jgi:hypothetical protein
MTVLVSVVVAGADFSVSLNHPFLLTTNQTAINYITTSPDNFIYVAFDAPHIRIYSSDFGTYNNFVVPEPLGLVYFSKLSYTVYMMNGTYNIREVKTIGISANYRKVIILNYVTN